MASRSGITWQGQHLGHLQFKLRNQERRVNTVVQRVLEDAAQLGEDTLYSMILTTESGIVKGKMNRVLTGNMLSAVSSKIEKNQIRVGWVKERDDYFISQDQGTGDRRSGGYSNIRPMHGLLAVALAVTDQVRAELRKNL